MARLLITATDVEAVREGGIARLEVPKGAIVTPLAREAARRLGVALISPRSGRRPYIFGNWKAHGRAASAVELAKALASGIRAAIGCTNCGSCEKDERCDKSSNLPSEPAVFPPLVHLPLVAPILARTPIRLGAQDLSPFPEGATTGAVPAEMLRDLGCRLVLVGHSERRRLFGERGELIAKKLRRALDGKLDPVLLVGETLAERDAAQTHAVLRRQLLEAFDGIEAERAARVIIAYEPVWAIGTGLTPLPDEVEDALSALRDHLARKYGDEVASAVRLLYGGSVTAANAGRLLALPSCDGALVGGASLDSAQFLAMCGASPGS